MERLNGKYQHNIDAKGRLALPARFRKILPETLVLSVDPTEALCVYTEEGFAQYVDSLFAKDGGFDPSNERHVQIDKILNGESVTTTLDSAGRISIPLEMREDAHLEHKEALVVGVGSHLEIWDEARWQEFKSNAPSLRDLIYTSHE